MANILFTYTLLVKRVTRLMFSVEPRKLGEPEIKLTIGSCFSVDYRVMEHAASLESTKEA